MKKINLILSVILCLTTAQLSAQTKNFGDRVFLKDGSKLSGAILKYEANDFVLLELVSGQQVRLLAKDIKKVVMGGTSDAPKAEKPYEFKERGLYNATSFMFAFAKSGGTPYSGVGVQHVVGYQFSRKVGAGLGVAYENQYLVGLTEGKTIALFGEVRGYLSRYNTAFYYSVSSGLVFPIAEKGENLTNYRSGFMVYPAIGLRFGASSHFNFFVDIGAKFQRVYYERVTEWITDRYDVNYRRWVLRGGILF